MYVTVVLAEGGVPVDLVGERIPGKADDGHAGIAQVQDVDPIPSHSHAAASRRHDMGWVRLVSVCIIGR